MDFCFFPAVKEHVYAVPPGAIEVLVVRFQEAGRTLDANIVRRVREIVAGRNSVYLNMEHLLSLRGAHSFTIDSLHHFKPNVTDIRCTVFSTSVSTSNHTMESLCIYIKLHRGWIIPLSHSMINKDFL
jgi:hypothetical protein